MPHDAIDPHNPHTNAAAPRVLTILRDEVEVTRLAPAPVTSAATARHESNSLAAARSASTAGLLPAALPHGLLRALTHASIEPPRVMSERLRTGLVSNGTETADISILRTTVSPLTILPGDQPRGAAAGGRADQVAEPADGHDAAASSLGLRVLVFDDTEHLRQWCADTLRRSLSRATQRGRPHEIAATGVRRPVMASMVLLKFCDGTADQWVPMLSDGMSRHSVCAAGLLGLLETDPTQAADALSRHLLTAAGLSATSPSHGLARRMRRNHQTVANAYMRHLDDGVPDEVAVRIRQFLAIPVELHLVATDPESGRFQRMDSVMESVVSDQHTGVDGWASEDNARHTAIRALKRLDRNGQLNAGFLDLCAGRPANTGNSAITTDQTARRVATDQDPFTYPDRDLLHRAVRIMSTLLGPSHYEPFKAALRLVSGRQRLTTQQVVEYVAPLVCSPWGTSKPITRAWSYGGPVPGWIRDTPLAPLNPDDYLTLVKTALDPDATDEQVRRARCELALAGGTALIADGTLTTAIVGGSGSAPTPLSFRGSVASAIEALASTETGLTVLAVAANHFRPSRPARTSRLPDIDPQRSDRVARDGVGVPVRITETAVANYAALVAPAPTQPDSDADRREPTPLENLRSRARTLPAEARTILRSAELTRALHDETGGPSGLSEHDLEATHDSLSQALRLVGRLT